MLRVDALKKSQGVGFFSSAFLMRLEKKTEPWGFSQGLLILFPLCNGIKSSENVFLGVIFFLG